VSKVITILKEIFGNLTLIWTVARYNNKATFQGHYFGLAWEILNPMIQIALNWFVFSAIRNRTPLYFGRGDGVEVPFLAWMLIGMSAWLLMNRATLTASKSVQSKIKLVSKMQFPISVLPAMDIAGKVTAYFITLGIVLIILLFNGVTPTIFWFQAIYYIIAMYIFIYFLGLLTSTITILFKDFQQILAPIVRLLFWFSGVVWNLQEMVRSGALPASVVRATDLNPFSYIITGFRNSFLSGYFFWEHWETTLFFWLLVLVIALIGSHLHLKLRNKFVDMA